MLIITTNSENSEDFRIVEAPVETPGKAHWHEIVPHKPGRLIIETAIFENFMARLEREDSLPRIVITPFKDGALDTASEHNIQFDEEAYALGMSSGLEFDTTNLRITYSSMTTPAETYDYDMAARTRTLRKRQTVPSGHNPEDYVTRRLFAPTADGETVPVTLLYKKSTPLDGSAPVLLYGYGAYGISMPAAFATARLSLVDRGFIYAIAHIRGGKDKGYRWYTNGKMKSQGQHLHGFHRSWRLSRHNRIDPTRPHRRARRVGRWHVDGRSCQHGARSVPWHHCRSAVCRRLEHHARQGVASDAAGVARVGQPDPQRGRVRYISKAIRPTTTSDHKPIRTSWRLPA